MHSISERSAFGLENNGEALNPHVAESDLGVESYILLVCPVCTTKRPVVAGLLLPSLFKEGGAKSSFSTQLKEYFWHLFPRQA